MAFDPRENARNFRSKQLNGARQAPSGSNGHVDGKRQRDEDNGRMRKKEFRVNEKVEKSELSV